MASAPDRADRADLDDWERRAEQAYAEMYEARRAKEPYEDACFAFARAIEEAQRLGLNDQVGRLERRLEHVRAVYNSQFRGF
jgi:chromosome segregation ATPase